MLHRERETLRLHKGRGIDQFVRLNSRGHAKESMHKGEPDSGAKSRESSGRHAKIGEEPGPSLRRRASELLHDEP